METRPSADERPPETFGEDEVVFRRGKLRKRDDPAFDLFREARESLGDPPRVKSILFELGRLYNPLTNGPILDLASRRRIVELLEAGAGEEAGALLEQCAREYARPGDGRPEPEHHNPQRDPP